MSWDEEDFLTVPYAKHFQRDKKGKKSDSGITLQQMHDIMVQGFDVDAMRRSPSTIRTWLLMTLSTICAPVDPKAKKNSANLQRNKESKSTMLCTGRMPRDKSWNEFYSDPKKALAHARERQRRNPQPSPMTASKKRSLPVSHGHLIVVPSNRSHQSWRTHRDDRVR